MGIWVTNRAAHRQTAAKFLEFLGLTLSEEWIWAKVSPDGEWTVPLESGAGNGRRPYEIMLVGRRQSRDEAISVKRQIVFAVPPREHSRKPREWCDLVARSFGSKVPLELFARDLRSGWWSWGTECLKFQDLMFWNVLQ